MEEIWRTDAARNLIFFPEYVSGGAWQPAPHLELLAGKLQAIAQAVAGRDENICKRLIVEMPPRHGKSEFASGHFPCWFLGNYPELRVLLTSYGADLAEGFGRKNRNLMAEWGPVLWDCDVAEDSAAMSRWDIKGRRGGMVCAGVGGPITGKGGHLCIIDDPIKNAEEANSATYRDKIWDWYRTTLRTRVEPGGAIIVILTRWHDDDIAGRLLKQAKDDPEADQWEVLSLSAIAGENDPMGRQPGEPLWPQRYDKKALSRIKQTVGSYWWASLYQQKPSPQEGGILKRGWWQFYRQAPAKFDEVIQSWDCTFKDEKASKSGKPDYVVGQAWGRIGADKYLLDQVRGRMDFPATIQAVRTFTAKWPQARAKLVEDKANGPAVIATLKREIPGLIAVNPEGGKVVRAQAVSPDIEAGNVYLPDPSIAPWIHDFIEECAAFPNGANDDQVDATTQALNRLASSARMSAKDQLEGINNPKREASSMRW